MITTDNNPNYTGDVLRLVFENQPTTQNEVARRFGITRAASNLHFQKLAAEHYVRPRERGPVKRGRPSQLWEIDSEHNLFLGTCIEDDAVHCELADANGNALGNRSAVTSGMPSRRERVDAITDTIADTLRQGPAHARILQHYIGLGGAFTADGTILLSANQPMLNGCNFDRLCAERFGISTFSDSFNAPVLLGQTDDCPPGATVALIDWCEGLGVLFAYNGRQMLWPTHTGLRCRGLWDVGHINIERDGLACRCGRRGCLEAYTGGWSLYHRNPKLGVHSARELAAAALAGNSDAGRILSDAVTLILEKLYFVFELFGVDTILFSNVLGTAFPAYENAVRIALDRLYVPGEREKITVRSVPDFEARLRHGTVLAAREFFLRPELYLEIRGMTAHGIPGASVAASKPGISPYPEENVLCHEKDPDCVVISK